MRVRLFIAALAAAASVTAGCRGTGKDPDPIPVSSRAYKGHETDADMNNLVAVYNSLVGTRLDDCQTCHKGGDIVYATKTVTFNPCSFCHLVPYPDATIVSGAPTGYADTLNPYGQAYMTNGRTQAALRMIENQDSDIDTWANGAEIEQLRYPGDATSMPGQPFAPIYTLTWEAVHSLTSHRELLLQNSHKQATDEYVIYEGVKVKDLLAAAGVNLTSATGITVIAPDGFMKDFTLDNMNIQYLDGIYDSGLEVGGPLGANGFVTYPPAALMTSLYPTLADMGTIPDQQWLLIAHTRDGAALDVSYLDPVSGKINGEGPYRIIVPQTTPGQPDRGSTVTPVGDGYDYLSTKDHNAGNSVRGVVAIRVNPMPASYEEYDWKNGGWSLITDKKIIIYGEGVTGN